MKINISEDGYVELCDVYNPVYLKTDDGEQMNICMRDSGFEFEYMDKIYSAQEGIIKRRVIEKKNLIDVILLDLACDVQYELLRQCKKAGLDDCQTDTKIFEDSDSINQPYVIRTYNYTITSPTLKLFLLKPRGEINIEEGNCGCKNNNKAEIHVPKGTIIQEYQISKFVKIFFLFGIFL